jgi:hypothetical protein
MIEPEFSALQRLTSGNSFVKVWAGRINLFIEEMARVYVCPSVSL